MYYFLSYLFESIFPPSEDLRIVRALSDTEVFRYYRPYTVHGVLSLMDYRERAVRALIHEVKFQHNTRATTLLGAVLDRYLISPHLPRQCVLIPIPLSRARMRRRGYNQVTEVLRMTTCVQDKRFSLCTDVLIRTQNTQPQTELSRADRLTNVRGAFTIADSDQVHGAHVILVDDVTTTGATLDAARTTLMSHHPASVICIALAH